MAAVKVYFVGDLEGQLAGLTLKSFDFRIQTKGDNLNRKERKMRKLISLFDKID